MMDIMPGDRVGVRINGHIVMKKVRGLAATVVIVKIGDQLKKVRRRDLTSVEHHTARTSEYDLWRAGKLLIG